jgi:predicted nucleic acid-binding protein
LRIFDTTFVVDLVNSDSGAVRIAEEQAAGNSPSVISAVTVHEYLFGMRLRYGQSPELAEKLSSAARDLAPFDVLPLTREVAEESAHLQADLTSTGKQIGINDVYIGATAVKFGLELVTRNKRHFSLIPSLVVKGY